MKKAIIFSLATLFSSISSEALLPRKELFKPSPCVGIKVSPDGKQLAFVGQDENGAMNLFVSSDLSLETAKQATHFNEPEMRGFYWSCDCQKILFLKDQGGTRQYALYAMENGNFSSVNLSAPFGAVNAKVFQVSSKEKKAVVGINNRNPAFHDIYLLDMEDNSLSLIYKNDRFIQFLFDENLEIAVKIELNSDSSLSLWSNKDEPLFSIESDDAFSSEILSFDKGGLYLLDCRGSNTNQLKKIALNGKETLLGTDQECDIRDVFFEKGKPVLFASYYTQKKWHALTHEAQKSLDFILKNIGANFEIISSSAESKIWILKEMIPERGACFWLYNRSDETLQPLKNASPLPLAKMHPLIIEASDGKKLVSYLTIPSEWDDEGRPKKPLPLVVIPHGGPFKLRDLHQYSADHQWLANRGYAVLSVNFRLSSGFGKDFVNAGNGEWGGKAHNDILEAVQWCIDQRIALKDKIAVFGGSYGGYEALASLTFSPAAFACAVAICGPSSLKSVLKSCPFYWEFPASPLSERIIFYTRNSFFKSVGGNPYNESDTAFLNERSPITYVGKIEKPLLLIHGANDPIVHSEESDQIFQKMKENDRPVIYLSYPDEGHGIRKTANAMVFLAYAEWMLAQVLGGKFEPLHEEDLKASSVQIQSHGMHYE